MTITTETFPALLPGQIVATPRGRPLEQHGVSPDTILRRHLSGDWGTPCSDDVALNDEALRDGSRILSSYESRERWGRLTSILDGSWLPSVPQGFPWQVSPGISPLNWVWNCFPCS